jgi:hypothetical protein
MSTQNEASPPPKHPSRRAAPYLRVRRATKGKGSSKALAFFNKCPWDQWWHEFITARQKNGRMVYLTAYRFAKAKAKTEVELELIYRSIGPKPITLSDLGNHSLDAEPGHKVPYLGDWQQIRAKAYFYDHESLDKLKQVTAERLNGLEAGQGAATIIMELIAEWMKADRLIDEVFGPPLLEGLTDAQNEKRSDRYFKMKDRTRSGICGLIERYLLCHGIATDGMNDLGRFGQGAQQFSSEERAGRRSSGGSDWPGRAFLSRGHGPVPGDRRQVADLQHAFASVACRSWGGSRSWSCGGRGAMNLPYIRAAT